MALRAPSPRSPAPGRRARAGSGPAARRSRPRGPRPPDRKSTRLNSSPTVIYTLSLHDALPIYGPQGSIAAIAGSRSSGPRRIGARGSSKSTSWAAASRSEEHTSELQSHSDLHSFPTRRSSDLWPSGLHRRDRRLPVVGPAPDRGPRLVEVDLVGRGL